MNIRWLWFDHIPPGVDLTAADRREVRRRSKTLRTSNPRSMRTAGPLVGAVVGWSLLEAVLLLGVVLYVFPRAQSRTAQALVIYGLPVIIGATFWLLIAMTFNRFQSGYVRRALNDMGYSVCLVCGYALRGLKADADRCPECGTPRAASSTDRSNNTS